MPLEAVRALSLWVVVSAAAVVAWRPLARRTGWAAVPTLVLLLWLGLVLSMTVPFAVGPGVLDRAGHCVSHPLAHMAWSIRTFGARGVEDVMNVALWVPAGFLGVLATRRAVLAPLVIAGGFVVVEFLQTLDPGRECDSGDFVYNSAGVCLGAVAAVMVRKLTCDLRRQT